MNDRAGSPAHLRNLSIAEQHRARIDERRNIPATPAVAEGPIDRMIRTTSPWLAFTLLVVVGAAITAGLSWGVYYWGSDFILPASAPQITDQSLASYVGSIFGTSVALAGSFVAIVLAKRAVELSESQNRLAERQSEEALDLASQQTRLAEESVRLADRQSLEAEAAAAAAEEYRRLKGMLITFPAILRKAQRDGVFAGTVDVSEISGEQAVDRLAILNGVIEPIASTSRRFLESGAPSAIISLSKAIDRARDDGVSKALNGTVQDQRYFEYATSSLYYESGHLATDLARLGTTDQFDPVVVRNKFFRVLHGIYDFVNQTDDLICLANAALSSDDIRLPDHDRRFATQTLPVAELNRHLSLRSDFAKFSSLILQRESITRLSLLIGAELPESAFHGEEKGGIVFSLHESGLSELITKIRASLTAQSRKSALVRVDDTNWTCEADALKDDTVPVFLIAENHDSGLCRLSDYLTANPEKFSMCAAVLDQADLASDTWTSGKHLTMDDALQAWRSFMALDLMFNEIFEVPFARTKEDFIQHARYQIKTSLHRFVTTADAGLFKGGSYFHDGLMAMCEAAAQSIGCTLLPGEASCNLLEFEQVLMGFVREGDSALSDENLGKFYDEYGLDQTDYQNTREVVRELAKTPFLHRPLYAFRPAIDYMIANGRDVALPNTALFGIAYCDSSFDVRHSPLLQMLSGSGRGYRLF